ncbi:MAG: acyltransferase [Marmoricola sp.]
MDIVTALLLWVLPQRLKHLLARHVLHWDVHPTAYIGRSIVRVGHLSMGPGSSIGPHNVVRGLDELRLGEGASIARDNTISAFPSGSEVFPHSPNRQPVLVLGPWAMITHGHELDCSDRVELGPYARLAGFRSQILTHSLDLVRDRFVTTPVHLGERCAVMSGCILLNGTRVPPRSIVSAGSVVATRLTKELTFYRGNPAEPVRELPASLAYFHHEGPPTESAWDRVRAAADPDRAGATASPSG